MKRYIIAAVCLAGTCFAGRVQAQEPLPQYRRSSVYSLLVNHTEQKFADEIRLAFLQIPVPDRFNNHNLSVKVLNMDEKLRKAGSSQENPVITDFLVKNQVASRLVAKWFDRDGFTGACNMELVKERGLYNASEFDRQLAMRSSRGLAMLQDAGEELIGNTFVLVNDIRYIDKAERSKKASSAFKILGAVAQSVGYDFVANTSTLVGATVETLKGFSVRINTFLYRLEWNEEQAAVFYREQYAAEADTVKRNNFDRARGSYTLRYVGKVESRGKETSFLGINEDEPVLMVRKACQRAIDENIVDLQRAHEEFRSRTPLVSVEPLQAYIGMKEGVTAKSRFEVLEMVEMENGSVKYNRVGIVAPVESLIWDNRFMAAEEGARGADLGMTTFRKVSGKDFAPGMLLREI